MSELIICYMSICILLSPPVVLSLDHFPEKNRRNQPRHEVLSESCKTMRAPGVRGESEGRRDPAQMCRVQGRAVLRQKARRNAQARARELLQRADTGLRLPRVRETCFRQLPEVQGGDVLLRSTQVEALCGARERVRGASLRA